MAILVFGLIVFLGVHSVRMIAPGLRQRIIDRTGPLTWKLAYTGMALIGLSLIVLGYGLARRDPWILYAPPFFLRHVALLVMLPVFPLLLAAYLRGRITVLLGHPMLIATILWALAHLMANGSMADVLLFGGFLVWAVFDWGSNVRRQPSAKGSVQVAWGRNDLISIVGGLVAYGIFVGGLHAWLFGVSPM